MSYEGYHQFICPRGHYWTEDVYASSGICPECGRVAIWTNPVDETNGTFQGDDRIDGYVDIVLRAPAVYEECPTCNHREMKEAPVYVIPSHGGYWLFENWDLISEDDRQDLLEEYGDQIRSEAEELDFDLDKSRPDAA